MITGYSTVIPVVVLRLMLGYFYFSYLIRVVVFSTGIALWIDSLIVPLFDVI